MLISHGIRIYPKSGIFSIQQYVVSTHASMAGGQWYMQIKSISPRMSNPNSSRQDSQVCVLVLVHSRSQSWLILQYLTDTDWLRYATIGFSGFVMKMELYYWIPTQDFNNMIGSIGDPVRRSLAVSATPFSA